MAGETCITRVAPHLPRAHAHAYAFQNFEDSPAEMLIMVTPGRFNLFFEELSSLNAERSTLDMTVTECLMNDSWIELLGPPHS